MLHLSIVTVRLEIPRRLVFSNLDWITAWGVQIPKKSRYVFLILWVLFELLKYVRDCMVVLTVFVGRSCMWVQQL